jgi:hypothetical protein
MATQTVTYSYLSGLESFTGVPGAESTMSHDSGNGNPSGSLKTVTAGRNKNNTNYWYLDTTWSSLGVPAGATVTHCRLNGSYYYQGLTDWLEVDSVTAGPYEIRTTDDITTIATLWSGATETTQGSGWTSVGAQSDQSIGGAYQSASTNIRLRWQDNIDLGNNGSAAASLHEDEIEIVITYTVPDYWLHWENNRYQDTWIRS